MKTEEFYKKIQQKISNPDLERESTLREYPFGEYPFGESRFHKWNKQDVWQRIEQKHPKRKKAFVWWQAVAASIIFFGSLGIYFYNNETKVTTYNQVIKEKKHTLLAQSIFPPTTKPTQPIAYGDSHINGAKKSIKTILLVNKKAIQEPSSSTKEVINLSKGETVIPANESSVNPSPNETEISQNQIYSAENYRFVPYQGLLEKRIAPQRRERVAILEIPDDENTYTQTPKKVKKNGFVTLLSKKIGKKGVESNEELPSINGKPNKVWAFVKESFKNETILIDSTNR